MIVDFEAVNGTYCDTGFKYVTYPEYDSRVYSHHNEFFEDVACDVYIDQRYITIRLFRAK